VHIIHATAPAPVHIIHVVPPAPVVHRVAQPPPTALMQSVAAALGKQLPAAPECAQRELDVAFCCDSTGSMGKYIRSAQDNMLRIITDIRRRCGASGCDTRYALVKYRDHPPLDRSFVTETFPFTRDAPTMQRAVDTMKAAGGGGDGPEAVASALHAVNELQWRPNATKVVVLIADAPPHGLGERSDGFPGGCPEGHDPIALCKAMAAKGIVIYAVGVEPVLSSQYIYARDFMMAAAQITEGKFLPLGKASILSDVIVAGAVEGMEMAHLWTEVEVTVRRDAALRGESLDRNEVIIRVGNDLRRSRRRMQTVDVTNPYMAGYDNCNVEALCGATNLREGQSCMRPAANATVAAKSSAFSWDRQQAQCATDDMMSSAQCARMCKQAVNRAASAR
jgi:hypothetical protein